MRPVPGPHEVLSLDVDLTRAWFQDWGPGNDSKDGGRGDTPEGLQALSGLLWWLLWSDCGRAWRQAGCVASLGWVPPHPAPGTLPFTW